MALTGEEHICLRKYKQLGKRIKRENRRIFHFPKRDKKCNGSKCLTVAAA